MGFFNTLDQKRAYKIDTLGVYESILKLGQQLEHGFRLATEFDLPKSYSKPSRIVLAGMGGSALGGRIIKSLSSSIFSSSIDIHANFGLPNYVNEKTLVILSSYSGNTDETLEAASAAIRKKAKTIVITTGGKLGGIRERQNWPGIVFEPIYNPSNQPRMAIGYNLGFLLGLLSRLDKIRLRSDDIRIMLNVIANNQTPLSKESSTSRNPAKKLAETLKGKIIILVAAEHLGGAVHTIKNLFNENAKTYADLYEIPELDHHLLEGLSYPKDLTQHSHFIFIDSPLYSRVISKQFNLTREIVTRSAYSQTLVRTEAKRPLAEIVEVLQFGAYVSYYLAIHNKVNPGPIPIIDFFKKRLAENA